MRLHGVVVRELTCCKRGALTDVRFGGLQSSGTCKAMMDQVGELCREVTLICACKRTVGLGPWTLVESELRVEEC